MIYYELKWNEENKAGYVVNDVYPNGYVFEDASQKPDIGFEYSDLNYSESSDVYYVVINDNKIELINDDKLNVLNACSGFVDTRLMTPETSLESLKDMKKKILSAQFTSEVNSIVGGATYFETASWRKQEEQARAWTLDNTVVTPLIDSLLETRNIGKVERTTEPLEVTEGIAETKAELVAKIIGKADAYEAIFGQLLGNYQTRISAVDAATTVEELQVV